MQLWFQSWQHSEKSSCWFNTSWHQVAWVWLHCRVEWEKWTQQGTFPFEKYNAVSKNSDYQRRFISTLQNISPNHLFSPHPTPNTSYQFQHWLSQSLIGVKTFSFSHWRVIGDHNWRHILFLHKDETPASGNVQQQMPREWMENWQMWPPESRFSKRHLLLIQSHKCLRLKATEVFKGIESNPIGGTGVTCLWYHKAKRKDICMVVCHMQEKKQKWFSSLTVGDRDPLSLV